MRYKKFVIIPIMILAYAWIMGSLSYGVNNPLTHGYDTTGSLTILSIGESIGVIGKRSYYLGLINLPFYTNAIGDIGFLHHFFFYRLVPFIFIVFVGMEFLSRRKRPFQTNDLALIKNIIGG